jgi:hypothetical protein
MGFGFNLFGFPILVLISIGLLIYLLISKNKIALIILASLWGLLFLFFELGAIARYYRKPISLTRNDIVGEYRIDTTFYSGKNATWQYNHYKFFITKKHSIMFVEMNDKGRVIYREVHDLKFSNIPVTWEIKSDTLHHVIRNNPTLYRSHSKFYYVFHSVKFGNMFFRKIEND